MKLYTAALLIAPAAGLGSHFGAWKRVHGVHYDTQEEHDKREVSSSRSIFENDKRQDIASVFGY